MAAFLKIGDIKGEFASKAKAYGDEDVDGFMKLGDIKGEIVRSDVDEIIYGGGGQNDLNAFTYREDGAGRFTTGGGGDSLNAWRDLRHGSETFEGFVIPTDGDDIVRGEFASKANAYVDGAIGGFQAEALTNAGQKGFTWEAAADIWTTGGASTFNADALVQQVNGTIGYEMQPADFANNQGGFETGLSVEGIGLSNSLGSASTPMEAISIDASILPGVISRSDMFAAANELRSDNRF